MYSSLSLIRESDYDRIHVIFQGCSSDYCGGVEAKLRSRQVTSSRPRAWLWQ